MIAMFVFAAIDSDIQYDESNIIEQRNIATVEQAYGIKLDSSCNDGIGSDFNTIISSCNSESAKGIGESYMFNPFN